MTKLCTHCGTQIPFIATRCPNCTSDLGGSGSSDAESILIFIVLITVFGIANCLGFIK